MVISRISPSAEQRSQKKSKERQKRFEQKHRNDRNGAFVRDSFSSERERERVLIQKKKKKMCVRCHPVTPPRVVATTSILERHGVARRRRFSLLGERRRRRIFCVAGGHCDVDDGYVGGSAVRHPKSVTVKLGESSITINAKGWITSERSSRVHGRRDGFILNGVRFERVKRGRRVGTLDGELHGAIFSRRKIFRRV